MKVDLDSLDPGVSDLVVRFEIETGAADIGPGSILLTGSLQVENVLSRVLISGTLEATGETSCHRCLDDFEQHFVVPVEIVILREQGREEETDTGVIQQRRGQVDLVPALRELAVLALPARRIPPEDEKGRCMLCGLSFASDEDDDSTEETDPRWDDLP